MKNDVETQFPVVDRNKADSWRAERDLKVAHMARAIGLKHSDLRRVLLPTSHPYWREASLSVRKKVRDFTGGAIGLSDWPEKPLPRPQHQEITQQTGAA